MPPDLSVGGHFLLCLPGECRHRCAQGVTASGAPLRCAQGDLRATSLRSGRSPRHFASLRAIEAAALLRSGRRDRGQEGGRWTRDVRTGGAGRGRNAPPGRNVRTSRAGATLRTPCDGTRSHRVGNAAPWCKPGGPAARTVSASGAPAAPPAPRHRAPRAIPSSRPPGRAPGAASPTDSTPGATQRGGSHAPPRRRSR